MRMLSSMVRLARRLELPAALALVALLGVLAGYAAADTPNAAAATAAMSAGAAASKSAAAVRSGPSAVGLAQARPAPAQPPGIPSDALPVVFLPVLDAYGTQSACAPRITVQNAGAEPSKGILVLWGEPEACDPLRVECSGLLQPGSSWTFIRSQLPQGARSAAVYSFNTKTLGEIGVSRPEDDIVADAMCEALFFETVGDCDAYLRFKNAYETGGMIYDIPQDAARGAPLAVEVTRDCTPDGDGPSATSRYNGVSYAERGRYDPIIEGHRYLLPVIYGGTGTGADAAALTTWLHVQNTGDETATVEVLIGAQDDCEGEEQVCTTLEVVPGARRAVPLAHCGRPGRRRGELRSSQPIAAVVDHLATIDGQGPMLASTRAPVRPDWTDRGDKALYGPLVYAARRDPGSTDSGPAGQWNTWIHVQNISTVLQARIKVYFADHSGNIVTTVVDWICPRDSVTLDLARNVSIDDWRGTVRVVSEPWGSPEDPEFTPPPLVGTVEIRRQEAGSATEPAPITEMMSYELLGEHMAYDWRLGSAAGGTESGVGLIAIPNIERDMDASGRSTELVVSNLVPGPGVTYFVALIYDQNGLIDYVCEKLNEKETEYIDLRTWGYLNPGFTGSAVISAVFWQHDVFDGDGTFIRSMLGLAAVTAHRPGATMPGGHGGDAAFVTHGIPFAPGDAGFAHAPLLTSLLTCGGGPMPPRATYTPEPTSEVTPAPTQGGAPTPTASRARPDARRLYLPRVISEPDASGPDDPPATPTAVKPTPTVIEATPTVAAATATPLPTHAPPLETPLAADEVPPVAFVSAMDDEGQSPVCRTALLVQNMGGEPGRAIVAAWGEAGDCAPDCAGPQVIVCSGLIRPGTTWKIHTTELEGAGRAASAVVYSVSGRTLDELGIRIGGTPDQPVATLLCDTLTSAAVDDCDDFQRFHRAFYRGDAFAGIPLDRSHGPPMAVQVLRSCPSRRTPGADVSGRYAATMATELPRFDPVDGGYHSFVPAAYGDPDALETWLYVQNAGLQCASVEIWFQAQDACQAAEACLVGSLAPGETLSRSMADCAAGGSVGTAWVRASQPVAVAVDHVGRDTMMSHAGLPGALRGSAEEGPSSDDEIVAYAPLVVAHDSGRSTAIVVQNQSADRTADVKLYLLDRDGDIVTTLVDSICPRGNQRFDLAEIMPDDGHPFVGSARVESRPTDDDTPAARIGAVALTTRYLVPSELAGSMAYPLLPEARGFDWPIGHGAGGTTSGAGLIAVPTINRDPWDTRRVQRLMIANLVPKPGFTDFMVLIYDQNGLTDYTCNRVNERQTEYIDFSRWGIFAPDFKGSVVISATYWQHEIFDASGSPVRNVVGLGAVMADWEPLPIGEDIPGDAATMTVGIPIAASQGEDHFDPGLGCPGQP